MTTAEEDYTSLPLERRLAHKVWKARVSAYEEVAKTFRRLDDEHSPEFNTYTHLIKSFVTDSNAVAQTKGLEAAVAFVQNAAAARKIAGDITAGVRTKCVNSAKTTTREAALELCLSLVEIEAGDAVVEQLIQGFADRQPKIVTGCAGFLREALCAFGPTAVPIKPILKAISPCFSQADKGARDEAKRLVNELHRWVGIAIMPALKDLKPVQIKELEDEFANNTTKAVPTRYRRCDQEAQAAAAVAEGADPTGAAEGADVVPAAVEVDTYDLADPVDVLAKLPKSFFEDMEAVKWSERKDALAQLLQICAVPKIVNNDFGEIVRVLRKVLAKETMVLNVALAADCLAALAAGLRKGFAPYAQSVLTACLEKFKEKKVNVVVALQNCVDKCAACIPFDKTAEECLTALKDKNPNVKAETAAFLARCITVTPASAITKPLLKLLMVPLLEALNDGQLPVRDAATAALARLLTTCGERALASFLDPLDKLKTDKIREAAAAGPARTAAPVSVAPSSPAKRPATAAVARKRPQTAGESRSATARPATAATRPAKHLGNTASSSNSISGPKKAAGKVGYPSDVSEPSFPDMSMEQAQEVVLQFVPGVPMDALASAVWKERLEGVSQVVSALMAAMTPLEPTVALALCVFAESKSKGWKDSNFQVMAAYFKIAALAAQKCPTFPDRAASHCMPGLVDKIGDIKLRTAVHEVLEPFCQILGCNYVQLSVCALTKTARNPKVHTEVLAWLGHNTKNFGLKFAVKPHVELARWALNSINPSVRTAAMDFVAVLRLYVGANVVSLFQDEKPAVLELINERLKEVEGQKPLAPTLFERQGESEGEAGQPASLTAVVGRSADVKMARGAVSAQLEDLVPRVDINDSIKPALLEQLSDANWKERGEALSTLAGLIKGKKIQSQLGDLVPALVARLGDSNKNHVAAALSILGSLATAMNEPIKRYLSAFMPTVLMVLADGKEHQRAAALATMDAIHVETGLAPFLEADVLPPAITSGKPFQQAETLKWLATKAAATDALPSFVSLVKPLVSALEDRNKDVRSAAQDLLPAAVASVGAGKLQKACAALTEPAKSVVMELINKAATSGSVPAKVDRKSTTMEPAVASKKPLPATAVPATAEPVATLKSNSKVAAADAAAEGSLLMDDGGKAKRIKDDKALKTLKWNFSVPRDEFINQLQDQLRPSLSASLYQQLFSADFKQHLKALDVLLECVSGSAPCAREAVAVMDLLLRWVTLRFFDTNPAVILKVFQFLKELFARTIEQEYTLTEYEASAFLPYLVIQSGHKIEQVREQTQALFKVILQTYPASKLFCYILDGLKSKNARQRAVCLQEIGHLIERNGMSVCQTGAAKSLKLLAQQVSDRDNTARSAALDTLVVVYNIVGDDIYKLMGQVSDKDRSLVQERIKRAGKPGASATTSEAPAVPPEPVVGSTTTSRLVRSKTSGGEVALSNTVNRFPPSGIKQEFSLDFEGLDAKRIEVALPELHPTDMADLLPTPTTLTSAAASGLDGPSRLGQVAASRLVPFSDSGLAAPLSDGPLVQDIDEIISKLGSMQMGTAIVALKSCEDVVRADEDCAIGHMDEILTACLTQLRILFTVHFLVQDEKRLAESVRLCKHLLSCILQLFRHPRAPKSVSEGILESVMSDLITRLLDPVLDTIKEGPQVNRALNTIILKILENAERNVMLNVLLRMLTDNLSGNTPATPRYVELVMKCIWKLTKTLQDFVDQVRIKDLLFVIERFFVAYPPASWRDKKDDTPFRTVKTIIHTLVKAKGTAIISHTSRLGDHPFEGPTGCYIILLLEKSGVPADQIQALVQAAARNPPAAEPEVAHVARVTPAVQVSGSQPEHRSSVAELAGAQTGDSAPPAAAKLRGTPGRATKGDDAEISRTQSMYDFLAVESLLKTQSEFQRSSIMEEENQPPALTAEQMEQRLQQIFDRIAAQESTKDGLCELYDFQQTYPDANVKPHMDRTSEFFQGYIRRGTAGEALMCLDEIGRERMGRERARKVPAGPTRSKLPVTAASSMTAASYLQRLQSMQAGTQSNTDGPPLSFSVSVSSQDDELPEVVSNAEAKSPKKDLTQIESLKARLAKFHRK